ncbi:MAG TPA: hypothetical protein VIP77_19490 [Jiangellaceae bacterium]
MAERDKRAARRLDQVDRRSQVGISRATRARDVSRPDAEAIAEALHRLSTESPGAGAPVRKPAPPAAEAAPESPRTG